MVLIKNLLLFNMNESSSFQDFIATYLPGKKTMSGYALIPQIKNEC